MSKKMEARRVLDDIEKNHNNSWYVELYRRNSKNLDDIALLYRGTKVSYKEMFTKMNKYAKSMKQLGINAGDEIPICMSNCPELIYIIGAASIIGAKFNIFGDAFDKDYITEIINECRCDVAFIEDNKYKKLEQSINSTNLKKIVITSLSKSLPSNCNLDNSIDKNHKCLFVDKSEEYSKKSNKNISIGRFEEISKEYTGNIKDYFYYGNLNEEFSITYSSGSTNSSRPKAIVHNVRSFITMGRYHDKEVSGSASMKNFVVEALIPTHSNTDIICGISDSLMQGSKLALEPIYDKDFLLDSLNFYGTNYVTATTSFWVNIAKQIKYNSKYKDIKLPNLLVPFAVGERLSMGEEKFINSALRKAKAGTKFIPLPVSPVSISVAGGDCEHGGIFWTLFRNYQNLKPYCKNSNHEHGLGYFNMVETAILDEKGNLCEPYKLGRLVANSPCTMKCYKNNEEATNKFFVLDSSGKTWADCNVYGYKDANGYVFMKGRIPETKDSIPMFIIKDAIEKDTKNIMSCEPIEDNESNLIIAHIEFQPNRQKNIKFIMQSVENRCVKILGKSVSSKIVFRIRNYNESFPLTGCGKRSINDLKREGLTEKCFKPLITNNDVLFINGFEYLEALNNTNKHEKK